ncbi:MAG: multi-sensor signal transduction histidine kinase, partial [Deinococcus sp.]|nr:multi-sensor signal transduction histidine kinase [Deinococcus sp.]
SADQRAISHLTQLLDGLLDPFFAVDREWRFTFVNQHAAAFMGRQVHELYGRVLWEVVPAALGSELSAEYRQVMTGREVRQFELDAAALGLWLELRAFPHADGIAVHFRDVTARKLGAQRREQLLDVTRALSTAVTEDEVMDAALGTGLQALGAYAGSVLRFTPEAEQLTVLRSAGYEAQVIQSWITIPLDTPIPVTDALRTGQALFLQEAELLARYPVLHDLKASRTHAIAVLPLHAHNRTIGALTLSFDSDRTWELGERDFMASLSAQLALALERSRLYGVERQRAEQLAFLAQASELLAGSRRPAEVLEQLASLAVLNLADWCSVRVPTEDGELRQAALAHRDRSSTESVGEYDASLTTRVEDERGAGQVFRTQQPLLIPSLTDEVLAAHVQGVQLEAFRNAQVRSVIVVPLVASGESLGVLSLVSGTPGRYGPGDLAFAQEFARRAASALENARLTDALRQEQTRLSAVLDQLPVAVWLAELPSGRMIAGNRAVTDVLHLPSLLPGSLQEYSAFVGHHPGGRRYENHEWPLARTITALEVVQDEMVETQCQDGSHAFISLSSAPVLTETGQPFLAVATGVDVTARVLAEREARELSTQLEGRVRERTAQLEALNTDLNAFSYSVSHDLRAPLRHIVGFIGLLRRSLGEVGPVPARYLGVIEQAAVRMGTLIDELLALAKSSQQPLTKSHVELETLVQGVQADLESELAGRRIEWRLADLPGVQADPGLLRQVFANLLGNAVKYTRPREQAVIEVWAETRAGDHILHVRDNGAGFDPQYANRLFEVFQRLHRAEDFEGNGVGLANVKRIVTRHGGQVWAEGRPDGGATFSFSLPAAEPH